MNGETYDLVATCAFGLEAVVRRELERIGVESTIGQPGRIHFRGTRDTICKANLWLRCADRVLIRVKEFSAPDFDTLFDTVHAVQWGAYLPPDAKLPVTGRSIRSKLASVPACQRTVKRGIVDALRRDHGVQELSEASGTYKIEVAIVKDVATLTIDTTGASLQRRGYRTSMSPGTTKETLAAAMVLLSYWKRDRLLIDPCCGSGTIPIEAAMIGRNLAPGRDRSFAAEGWHGFPSELWQQTRHEAQVAELSSLEHRLLGIDISGRALKVARENAERAGVAQDVHFQTGPLRKVSSRKRFGCLITHLPQRERRSDASDDVYSGLPDVLRGLPTWSHYLLTSDTGFERAVGREADRRRKLYNGQHKCTYYQFHGPKPVVSDAPAAVKADAETGEANQGESSRTEKPYVHAVGPAAFGHLDAKATHQAGLFATRLTKRAKHLRRWPSRRGITCFRLYERDIPEIPLLVDRYGDYLHITEYERPHDRDPAQHSNWLDLMARTAGDTLGIEKKNVFLKRRGRQRGTSQHEKISEEGRQIEVEEGGLKFLVNLSDYVDTGLFLDHRQTRQMIREAANGASFLNLFCYSGAFTVYAASGGAKRTVSVDLSKNYLDWAWQNMRLNGFAGNEHRYVASDVGQFIREHAAGETYDLVVLDPPTFSNSKRTDQDWNVQTDAVPLICNLMPLVRKGGIVYFSNNFRRFKFDPSQIPATEVREISSQTVPEDFRNRRIHRCWRIVR